MSSQQRVEINTWSQAPEVGQRITVAREGVDGNDRWLGESEGIYLGIVVDDEDGISFHRFADGHINGIAQSLFGWSVGTFDGLVETRDINAYRQAVRDAARGNKKGN